MKRLLLLLACVCAQAQATSITINDACASYNVSNANGVLTVSCAGASTTPPPGSTTPPPSSTDRISCNAYENTIVLKFPYVINSGTKIQTTQGMSQKDIIVAAFVTPPAPYPGGKPFIQITDNTPTSTGFTASMSTTPCTFPQPKKDTQSVSFTYAVQPNKTYYVNITGDSPLSVKLTAR